MKLRTPAQPHPQDGSLTLPRTQQVTQVSLPWCYVVAAPPNPILAQPPQCHPACLSPASIPLRPITVGRCSVSLVRPSPWIPHPPPSLLPSVLASHCPTSGPILLLPRKGSHHREMRVGRGVVSCGEDGALAPWAPRSSALPSHPPHGRPAEAWVAEPE